MTTSNIDQQVRDMITKVNQRQEAVDAQRATVAKSWTTTCAYRVRGSSSTINIMTSNLEQIQEIGIDLQLFNWATEQLDAKLNYKFPQKTQGYTVDQWMSDLNKRIAKINLTEEESKLAELQKRLNQVLSPEERRRIEVEMLMKEF